MFRENYFDPTVSAARYSQIHLNTRYAIQLRRVSIMHSARMADRRATAGRSAVDLHFPWWRSISEGHAPCRLVWRLSRTAAHPRERDAELSTPVTRHSVTPVSQAATPVSQAATPVSQAVTPVSTRSYQSTRGPTSQHACYI